MLRAGFITILSILFSRISGFARDTLMAHYLGAGVFSDCFVVAFRLPNFFRRTFAEGAVSSALIPLFTSLSQEQSLRKAVHHSALILLWMGGSVVLFVILIEIFLPWMMPIFAPGFAVNSSLFIMTLHLTRLLFPLLFLFSLAAFLGGILNTQGHFGWASSTPIILNGGIILGLLLIPHLSFFPLYTLAGGVLFGGVLPVVMLAWRVWRLKLGFFKSLLVFPRWSREVRQFFALLLPTVIGSCATQINLLTDTFFASFLKTGSLSHLFYADRLMQFPLGMFGAGLSIALLPTLSRTISREHVSQTSHNSKISINNDTAADTKTNADAYTCQSLQQIALLTGLWLGLPAALFLGIYAHPLVCLLFQRGAFDFSSSIGTSLILRVLSCGLPFFILIKILNTLCFAHRNTQAPMRIGIFCVVFNIMLNTLLFPFFGLAGIASATGLAAAMQSLFLGVFLSRKRWLVLDSSFLIYFFKIGLLVSIFGLFCIADFLFFTQSFTWITLMRTLSLSGTLFLALTWILGLGRLFSSFWSTPPASDPSFLKN